MNPPSDWPKNYGFSEAESKWYPFWESSGFFRAETFSDKPPFCIVIPPPNVTGSLHMGHALNNTLQDILVRYQRMRGFNVLWMPGTDHAGIATQNVVEKQLAQEGWNRHDLGREAFIERVWKWKEQSGGIILKQLRRLGASCDWERSRFTMDAGLSRAVKEVFIRLYADGLIHRALYLINWCPRCQTALSDLEVTHREIDGNFHHIRYPYADGSGRHLVIATTRPETLLGDTAVAVHPDDPRYSDLHGSAVQLPLLGRRLRVIADPYVDRQFGTGALKVTPGHDFNDFQLGKKHNLEEINIFTAEARINEHGGPYAGLDRFEARRRVLEDLEAQGLLEKIEPHRHAVGHCYRCDTPVEPWLSLQWFVKVQPLAEAALSAVRDGRIRIVPENWSKTYYNWMENIQDWCISRQIWWGHRIPAWHCARCAHTMVVAEAPTVCAQCGSAEVSQDPDVLDTWFSSGLWPFSTLGWPEATPELKTFYPTATLITGFDILFFWVARMIMMGLKFMGDVPFREVVLHALVRDAQGQKMSKSRGNVIDPLTVIDEYGADAFRFTLAAFAAQGRDIKLSEERIAGYKRFTQKIWNAFRFAALNFEGYVPPDPMPFRAEDFVDALPADHWILQKLDEGTREITDALENRHFDEAARTIYRFLWHELCDWYLELIKPTLQSADPADRRRALTVLLFVLDRTLRLLHPFMPFLSEELYQRLPIHGRSVMVADWPRPLEVRFAAEAALIDRLIEAVTAIRNLRGENGLKPQDRIDARISGAPDGLEKFSGLASPLAGLASLEFGAAPADPREWVEVAAGPMRIFIPRRQLIDAAEERKRLQKELARLDKDLEFVGAKLANPQFAQNAPEEIVRKEREKLETLGKQRRVLLANLANLDV